MLSSSAFLFAYTLQTVHSSNDLNILFCNFCLNKTCSHPFDNKTKGIKKFRWKRQRRGKPVTDPQCWEIRTNREEVVALKWKVKSNYEGIRTLNLLNPKSDVSSVRPRGVSKDTGLLRHLVNSPVPESWKLLNVKKGNRPRATRALSLEKWKFEITGVSFKQEVPALWKRRTDNYFGLGYSIEEYMAHKGCQNVAYAQPCWRLSYLLKKLLAWKFSQNDFWAWLMSSFHDFSTQVRKNVHVILEDGGQGRLPSTTSVHLFPCVYTFFSLL